MKRSAQTLGFTITASLALHGVLILAAAWLMAVLPERARKRPASLLITHSDVWQYRKGTSVPQSNWQTIPDDALDSTWSEGRGWIGYGPGTPGTILSDMKRTASSPGYRVLYLRKTFIVGPDLRGTDEAVLDIDFDDGFIAWVDGKCVDHEGLPGESPAEPAWDADITIPTHECSFGKVQNDPQPARSRVLGTIAKDLPPGPHILSVLLINDTIDSEDAVAKIELYTRKPLPEEQENKDSDTELPDEVTITFVPGAGIPEVKTPPADTLKPEPPGSDAKKKKFVYADGSQPVEAPLNEDTAFLSAQNMRAASTAAPDPNGDPDRMSQDGVDIPVFSLNTREYSEGQDSSPPAPPVRAQDSVDPPSSPPPPPPDPVKQEIAPPPPKEEDRPPDPKDTVKTSDPLAPAPADKPKEKIAETPPMRERQPETKPLDRTPPLTVRKALPVDPVTPKAKPSFSSKKSKSLGAIALRAGQASEDAKDTAEGRYQNIIKERVAMLWNAKLAGVRGLAGAGVVEVEYDIDSKGAVSGVKLVDPGKANAVLEDVCLTAIIKVKLPPPPEELLRELRDPLSSGKLHCTFTFYRL
jgi:outer membrane biosynthesis protein TonB